MKFGVREICDVVFRAKSARTIGTRKFYKNEPVLYFDSLKTSTLEGAVTTVYAQGGRGNSRLVAWDGERTLTFTMEDALISDIGIAILASASLIDAKNVENGIKVHATSTLEKSKMVKGGDTGAETYTITLDEGIVVHDDEKKEENFIYVMFMKNGEIATEPYIGTGKDNVITIEKRGSYTPTDIADDYANADYDQIMIDYYVVKTEGVTQVDITPETFGGNFYIEASTLFRDQVSGVDMPAEFIIPNGKVQSNFTFTMASSGDPSTFTFTVDAMPDYTRFDKSKKVLAAIQVITEDVDEAGSNRSSTDAGENA